MTGREKPVGIGLNERQLSDLELLRVGGYVPLDGFMTRSDYRSVVTEMHLASGKPWAMPITLAVDSGLASAISEGDLVALLDGASGRTVGQLQIREKFSYDKGDEARQVYRTTDHKHPGVAALYAQGDTLLGGPVTHEDPVALQDFTAFRRTPAELKGEFAQREWRTVVGFQTRNPVHRAHEYIQKAALEIVDGLLLHPLVGETKDDDVPADVRMRCYRVLLDNYFPRDRTMLAVLPAAMRYAGPREAIFHAQVRRNYGCTHFIVGRDHAGVGDYYGPYDAQHIFSEFDAGELGITPLFFEHAFWCNTCGGMATTKTCPHDASVRVFLSGTKVRELLRTNTSLPAEFTRPEVACELMAAYQKS